MASCILYHGPGAEEAAADEAHLLGRLLAPPFGAEGLKVEEAREFVALLGSVPIGTEKGVVIAGPVDLANYKAADVLLKSIEEFNSRFLQPILWAHDLGGVSPTIQSRCLARWAPPSADVPEDDELVAVGYDLIQASLEGEIWRIPTLIKDFLKDHKNGEHDILRSAADALHAQLDEPQHRALWRQLRKAARHRNPTVIEVTVAFLPPLKGDL